MLMLESVCDLHSIRLLDQSGNHVVEQHVTVYQKRLGRHEACGSLSDKEVDVVRSTLRVSRHL